MLHTNIPLIRDWPIDPNSSSSVHQMQKASLSHRINEVFKRCDHAWSYIGKSLLATRHFINAIVRSGRGLAIGCRGIRRMQTAVTHLKLFSVVSIPFNLAAMPAQIAKIGENIRLKDKEGIILSSLSASLISTDIFDSLTTFVNALLQTLSRTTLQWISSLGMPLSASMITMGSISRGMRLFRLSEFHEELERELIEKMSRRQLSTEELQRLLKSYLTTKIGVEAHQQVTHLSAFQIEQLEAITERHSHPKIVAMLKELKGYIKPGTSIEAKDMERISNTIQRIGKTLREEMGSQMGYLFTNLLKAIALTLFFLPFVPPLPFILLGFSMCLRLVLISERVTIEFSGNGKHKNYIYIN